MKISFQNLCTIGALEDLYELKKKKIKEIQRLKMFLVLFICIYVLELPLAVLDTIRGILKTSMCNIIFVLSGVIFLIF